MKIYYTCLLILFTVYLSPTFAQVEVDAQNKLLLNSNYIPGGNLTIGIDSLQGGVVVNSSTITQIGLTSYALNGVLAGSNGFDHDKSRYNIEVGGVLRVGVTADATTIFNTLETSDLHVSDRFEVGDDVDPLFVVDNVAKRMYYNTDQAVGAADFTLSSVQPTGFGGMYVNSEDVTTGKPYYGYATGGTGRAYHYYNQVSGYWNLILGTTNIMNISDEEVNIYDDLKIIDPIWGGGVPIFHVERDVDYSMYFNADEKVGLEDFTLNSANTSSWGGMYINSDFTTNGKPFYGYSTGGNSNAYHYYDAADDYWKLDVDGDEVLKIKNKVLEINGSIKVGNKLLAQPAGTIYYNGINFYGITAGGVARQLDNETTLAPPSFNEGSDENTAFIKLQKENDALKLQVENLETRLLKLEVLMTSDKAATIE